ncbi:MAG: radical SAM family heme chaperone HemW [Lachnospiraceae bacterium]|nr:radical SAM family heme chaperone HemW [Lachnospiraceae bacterium]
MREMELYIHIPFCVKKCLYCDFLSGPADPPAYALYVKRLTEEIEALAPQYDEYQVSSVYIGGGTPSILDPVHIDRLMDAVFDNFHIIDGAEITIECNPGTVYGGNARIMRKAGINRMSIGLQSIHNGELKLLGRIHTFEDFLRSFEEARKAEFTNINVDLIFGLPGQSIADWKETVKKTALLRPEHISAYSLIIEEDTPFYDRYHDDAVIQANGGEPKLLPSEEEEREMYRLAGEYLGSRGYRHYEISNYARAGRESSHNIGYWTGKEYLGLGLGAASLIGNVRFQNTSVFEDYIKKPFARQDEQVLDKKERIGEFMFLGLRMTDGVSRRDFVDRFECEPEAVYGNTLFELVQEELLAVSEGRIYLTEKGVDVSNTVFARLLL